MLSRQPSGRVVSLTLRTSLILSVVFFFVLQLWKLRKSSPCYPSWWLWAPVPCVWCLPSAGHPRRCSPTPTHAPSSWRDRHFTPPRCCCSPCPPQVTRLLFSRLQPHSATFVVYTLKCFCIMHFWPTPLDIISAIAHLKTLQSCRFYRDLLLFLGLQL